VSTPTTKLNTSSLHVNTPSVRVNTLTIRVPTVNVPNIRVPTVRVPTPTVRVATPVVRTPTVTVRTPTVRVPTVRVPSTITSDIRLKRDIVELGRLANGLHLYRYRYLWSDTLYVGVMAQEVSATAPEAVTRGADGYLRVDYSRLGLDLLTWDEWMGRSGEISHAAH